MVPSHLLLLIWHRCDVVIKCPHPDGDKPAIILFDSESVPNRLKDQGYRILELHLFHSKEFLEVLKIASKIRDAKNNFIAIHLDVWNKFCENVRVSHIDNYLY